MQGLPMGTPMEYTEFKWDIKAIRRKFGIKKVRIST